jgi:DNA (cytosine-5)-methyltransferase 1
MRTKNGNRWTRDARNELIFDVLRLVRSLKPKSVMVENVPGLAKSKRFAVFRNKLRALGYLVKWDILNAVNYAVPQKRRRLVLLASKGKEPEFAAIVANHRTVRDVIGRLSPPRRSRDPLHNYSARRSEKVEKIIKRIPLNGGSRAALGRRGQLKCHTRTDGYKDVYGRMAWDKPSPTITGGCINPSKGRFLHPSAHRAISLREAALLQTFPKAYRFSLDHGRYSAALLIGNALPPEFIKRLAQALRNSQTALHKTRSADASSAKR